MKKIILIIASVIMFGSIISIIIYLQYPKSSSLHINFEEQQDTSPEAEKLQPIYDDDHTVGYSLQNKELNITFDKGKTWQYVPVEIDKLFAGEYNGNKQELIKNSYILSENRVAFLYMEKTNEYENKVVLTYSHDQGKTWKDAIVTDRYPMIRFRKVAFLTEEFGYVIISGDRVVAQEASNVYITYDGGENWKETNQSGVTRLISDGGFIDEQTGFLSYGTINPDEPELYVTQDGGNIWTQAFINVPENYHEIFVTAEIPFKEEAHLVLLVNQGPNGDYKGGKVKGKFISKDNGKTWEFSKEIEVDEQEAG